MKRFLILVAISLGLLISARVFAEQNIIVLLGPPGAGKGSISKMLSEATHLPHISTGDLLRAQSKQNDKLAKELQSYLLNGQLVPNELILKTLLQRVEEPDCSQGFILDGFPRTKTQAEELTSVFPQKDHLIFVNVTTADSVILERLQGRRICSDCSRPYHATYNPPLVKETCNDCKGNLISREDDNYEVIKKRLDIYRAQYNPIKKYLKDNFQWIEVKNDDLNDCFAHLMDKVNLVDPDFFPQED